MRVENVDITTLKVDAIVNAANSSLLGGGGVDGAIHRVAGPKLLEACKKIRGEQLPDGLPVGHAVITPGFDLPARFVIHTVGPNRWLGQNDARDLEACFVNSARLALDHGLTTIAFPAISAGAFGWDMGEVAHIGVSALRAYPELDVVFAVRGDEAMCLWALSCQRNAH
ncbi:MAG: macro domain-containing protein [Actinomycetaceae bacterium]|nr:macro domain-containing protein [Arcanobacterium sp.]MDD7505788.1 macro domain-containing protein [Actinomycetaceae bacterium]MDY6142901.1 macro domain-containing protein [Arcanobacterium sp.]